MDPEKEYRYFVSPHLFRRTVLKGGIALFASADMLGAQRAKQVRALGGDGLHYASIMELAQRIRAHEVSPVEVTKTQLARIEALDTKLNAYREVLADSALVQARKAESEISAGRYLGPLHGVPIAVKDLFYTKGVATAGGCKVLERHVPTFDATVVARLTKAGAILLGKLNMTEGALSGYHREFRVPRNPWGVDRWPGVSSSGSAVATAAGCCYASLGTDTGGSIRDPSASNGIVGLKPTWGRVSRHGVLPLAPSLDHAGPMARRVIDAAIVLKVIAGYDPDDPTSSSSPVPDYVAETGTGIKGVRIGFDESFSNEGVSPATATAVRQAVQVMGKLGARVVPVQMPRIEYSETFLNLAAVEAAVAHESNFPSRANDYGANFRGFLERGRTISAIDYVKANALKAELVGRVSHVFRDIDILACPSVAREAFVYNPENAYAGRDVVAGTTSGAPVSFFRSTYRFTTTFDYNGYPTLSLPCGISSEGMPLSFQLVARPWGEAILCRAGHAYESATEWHLRHPPV